MNFSIVTPSYKNSAWLKLCVNSVADQQSITFEHIVQDSCSDDDTKHWLPREPRVKAFIEKDSGMYDAVNRGFRRAQGDLLAYLNCDEQYLPGALKRVADFFTAHPEVDALFADSIVTGADASYICHRPALVPQHCSMWVRFPILTCAMFLRRSVVHEKNIYFDTQWRDLGDFFFVHELVKRGLRLAVLPRFTSIFTDTGDNMNLKANALRERRLKWNLAPGWVRALKYFFIAQHRTRLLFRTPLRQTPFDYSLYTLSSPDRRVTKRAEHPTTFWRNRLDLDAITNPEKY